MDLYEAMFRRKSVRLYHMEALSPAFQDLIMQHYRNIAGIFGSIDTDIAVLDNHSGQQAGLSLFGVKAPYYLLFYSEEAPNSLMNIGYMMQQMALYLCSIGLGTCYVGSRKVRHSQLVMDGKNLVGILAFGKSKGPHLRKQSEAKRLPLEKLCIYKETPRQWIRQLLEGARMAPSYMNRQPWRFVVYDNRIHVFSKKDSFEKLRKWDEVNFGILFANMMVVADAAWLDVDLIRLEDISQKNFPNNQYVLSAVLKS